MKKFIDKLMARKKETTSRTLFIPKSMKQFWDNYNPKRKEDESMEAYRQRRKIDTGVLKCLKKRSLVNVSPRGKEAKYQPIMCGKGQSMYFNQRFSTKP